MVVLPFIKGNVGLTGNKFLSVAFILWRISSKQATVLEEQLSQTTTTEKDAADLIDHYDQGDEDGGSNNAV